MSDHRSAAEASRASWQPWQPDALAAIQEPAQAGAPDASSALAGELRAHASRMQEEARARGHAQGRAAGYTEGHAQGMQDGVALGHAEGLKAGHAEGFSQGRDAGAHEVATQAAGLAALADELARAVRAFESDTGEALVSLAIRIAEHVLHTALEHNPGLVADLARAVLRAQPEPDCLVTLRLHPDDAALLRASLQQDPPAGSWRIMADESVARGGCLASTALGCVDATLATRWKRVLASLGRAAEGPADARP